MNFTPEKENSYELLDSGEGMKLERFGEYVLSRPDPEALWRKNLPIEAWEEADAIFTRKGASGIWKKIKEFPKSWEIDYGELRFELRATSFKHVGIFPEQKYHWEWIGKQIGDLRLEIGEKPIRVLNLFAYTGGATLVAAKAGAEVTHVDSSKVAIEWARKNAELSGLSEKPIRWIEDDVLKFLEREVRRGNTYDAVVMDPPSFGYGSGTAVWKIERDFYRLFDLVQKVLSTEPVFVIVNGYAAGYSALTLANNLLEIKNNLGGTIENGELCLKEENSERALPAGIFARWQK